MEGQDAMAVNSPSRAAGLAFVTAAVTLFVQVLVHRIVSVKLLNNFAFLVISLTMLGFAVSGVVLSRLLKTFLAELDEVVALSTALFVFTFIGASMGFYRAYGGDSPFAHSRPDFVVAFFHWLPWALLYALPFALCGLILGLLLSAPFLPTRRIYFFDLIGSASGAFLVVPSISRLGVEASALLACAVLLLAGMSLARPRKGLTRLAGAAAAALILASWFNSSRIFDMAYPEQSTLGTARKPGSGVVLEHTVWDPVARIEVCRIQPPDPDTMTFPCLIGRNKAFHQRFKRVLTQNNYAFTYAVEYDGNVDSLKGIEETIYSAAYVATSVEAPRVLIVGVGGGFDILDAIYFKASDITAVEINAATVGILTRTYRDYFAHWVRDPRVHLINAEGRHFLASHPASYDIIQLSGVDSYSGTPGAAHVFSENYLYTSEAFDLYLSRLSRDGILNMMRLEYIPPREMLKALVTAVGALRRAGVAEPANNIMMVTSWTGNPFTALLVKKTPFTSDEQQRLQDWAGRSPDFRVSAGPKRNQLRENEYQAFLLMGDPRREAAALRNYAFDVSPTDDDRPFFFRYSFWWHIFPSSSLVWEDIPVMEYSVLLLLGVISLATLVCVYLPLRYLRRRSVAISGEWGYAIFFAGTGVGFLAIEVALLQKFGLFLGHPNYALSVVLASLLFASGVGSLFSLRITRGLGNLRYVAYLLAGIVLVEHLTLFPRLKDLITLPFPARVALVFALVAPIGVCLGVFVPSALEQLKRQAPEFVPWAWGINGIFSVLAPVVSVAFSMTWGISALLISAIPVYLVVAFALPPPTTEA
jgi:spermidine synthase